jgi:hypothetical protein
MQRPTGGQATYFRRRVRVALADPAEVRPITFEFVGHSVAREQIMVHPYLDDPLRNRFQRLAEKAHTFTLSEQVPGGVYRDANHGQRAWCGCRHAAADQRDPHASGS